MKRALGLAALVLGLGSGGARAQAVVDFSLTTFDTALTILTNRNATAFLRLSGVSGVSSYNITIFLDPARVQLVSADSVFAAQLPPPTVATSGELVTLSTSGPGTTTSPVTLARLTFHLDTLAPSGSLVSIRVNTLVDGFGKDVTPGHRTGFLQICQAEKIGGDVSGDRVVNSRDALIALTAAVGLPVGGFDVGRPGDVDNDRQTTSRDALFILSYGIGITSFAAPLLGAWLTNNCAPLAPAPNDMVFWRYTGQYTLFKVPAGDTLPTSLGLSGVVDDYARWSPDGTRLVFTRFVSGLSNEIMVVNADGTLLDTVTQNTASEFAPDWSPDGSKIAFVSTRVSPQSIFVMNADGTGQTRLTTTHTVADLAWSPDGVRLAFTGYTVCCTHRLWAVNADGTGLVEVAPGAEVHSPQDLVWSPSGDSLIYYSSSRNRVYKVGGTGDTVVVSPFNSGQDSPWWASVGHTFRSFVWISYDFLFRRASDGRHLRLTRGTGNNDYRLSVRRTLAPPTVYVDTVTVTPDSILLLPDSVDTLTVAVKNNNGTTATGAPVAWRSRDTTVAKVDATGIVTATKNAGVTYIVATSGWRSDSTKVVVAVTLTSVTAGGYHACGLTSDGKAYCWGRNHVGQLGTGTTISSNHPMRVAGSTVFTAISAGLEHTCAVANTGAAYCWGGNLQGQLGNGNTTTQLTPTLVGGGLTFLSVDAGAQFTCGVASGNNGFCWGDNVEGQLGDGTLVDKLAPTAVSGTLAFASISAATGHACGVTTGNLAYCWGDDLSGRLGDDATIADKTVPTAVAGGLSFASISAFDRHTCAVSTPSSAAYCWGYNGFYQLGDSTFTDRPTPTAVKGGLVWTSVVAGSLHTCGVTTSNEPYCWGYNGYGQIGVGSTTTRQGPVLVSGGLLMSALSLGQDFSCGVAIGTTPVVYCWGRNDYSQLGDGTTTNRLAPVRVTGQP